MRAYKVLAILGAVATMAGCAGDDGKDGAAGATGPKGDPGEAGTDGTDGTAGTDGTDGANGADAACAGVTPLAVTGVTGGNRVVFPGTEVSFTLELSGGKPAVSVQFLGTGVVAGSAIVPEQPVVGATPTMFTVHATAEGDARYVAIVSDGCSVTTTTFEILARATQLSFVNLYPGIDELGFAVRGETSLLTLPNGFSQVTTISPGEAFAGYFPITANVDFDAYPDGDLSETALPLPNIQLRPGNRVLVVAYADRAGELEWAVVYPDFSPIEEAGDVRVQLGNFVGTSDWIDVTTDLALTEPFFEKTNRGDLSDAVDLAPVASSVYIDVDGDGAGSPEWELTLPLTPSVAVAGDQVLLLAWNDADGELGVLAHVTAGATATRPGAVNIANAQVAAFLGAPDETGVVATATDLPAREAVAFPLPIDAPADCAVAQVIVRYDLLTEGSTWGSDVSFALTAPSGAVYEMGRGLRGSAGSDIGKLTSVAPRFEPVDGTWILEVENTFTDPATLNGATVEFYCGESLGTPDKVVTVDLDPDLAVPDDATASVTSTATVTGACTVRFITFAWNITHPFARDLQFSLTSPDGDAPVIIGRPSGEDSVTGTFPLVESFAGEDATGVWTLTISDLGASDEGTLDDWTLSIYCE